MTPRARAPLAALLVGLAALLWLDGWVFPGRSLRVDTPATAAHHDGVYYGAAPGRLWMAQEKPALAPDRYGSNRVLTKVVVDFKLSVFQAPQ